METLRTTFTVANRLTGAVYNVTMPGRVEYDQATDQINEYLAEKCGCVVDFSLVKTMYSVHTPKTPENTVRDLILYFNINRIAGGAEIEDDGGIKLTILDIDARQMSELQQYIYQHYGYYDTETVFGNVYIKLTDNSNN